MSVIAFGLAAFTALSAFGTVRQYRRAKETLGWNEVDGTVTWAAVVEERRDQGAETERTVYAPEIRYSYEAGGLRHEGSRVFLGDEWSEMEGTAREIVEAYPPGARVKVYVDPAHTGGAVLRRGDVLLRGRLIVVGALAAATAVAIIFG